MGTVGLFNLGTVGSCRPGFEALLDGLFAIENYFLVSLSLTFLVSLTFFYFFEFPGI